MRSVALLMHRCITVITRGWRQTLTTFPGPGLDSQHLHGSSQPSVTPAPQDLMPSPALHGCCEHIDKAGKITICTKIEVKSKTKDSTVHWSRPHIFLNEREGKMEGGREKGRSEQSILRGELVGMILVWGSKHLRFLCETDKTRLVH